MKRITLILIFLITSLLSAQQGLTKVALGKDFTARNDVSDSIETTYLNLPETSKSPYKYYFRYRKVGQIVDIFSNDSLTFKGSILNKIIGLKPAKLDGYNSALPEYYSYETVEIDENDASEIGRLIIKEEMYHIPTDTLLKNWNLIF